MAYLLWKLTRSISSFISAIALISRILVIHLNATERRSETCERSAFVGKCLVYTYQYRKQKSNAKVFSTYIHNWSLQPLVRIIDLVSYTTYVVCFNFIREWRDLQFKVDSERPIFEKLFMAILLLSQSFCQKCAEKKSPKKYFSYFVLMSGLGLEPCLISQHTTY